MSYLQGLLRVFFVALMLGACASALEPPAALVTDLQGKVPGISGILVRLAAGTQLALGGGTRVTLVFLQDGHRETASGPCQLAVAPEGLRLQQGGVNCLVVEKALSSVRISGGDNLEQIGGSIQRGGGIRPTSPRAFRGRPRLSFDSTLPGPFQVTLTEAGRNGRKVWSVKTSQTDVDYQGPDLEPDRDYGWSVQSTTQPTPYPPGGLFRILSPRSLEAVRLGEEEAAALSRRDPGDPTAAVLLVALYTQYYLLDEAIEATCRAYLLRPSDPGLRNLLQALLQERG